MEAAKGVYRKPCFHSVLTYFMDVFNKTVLKLREKAF